MGDIHLRQEHSAKHRALHMHELVELIVDKLNGKAQDFAQLATTTCTFFEVCIPKVWKEIPNLSILLRLLPKSLLPPELQQTSTMSTNLTSAGGPTAVDIERWKIYARHVKMITINTSIDKERIDCACYGKIICDNCDRIGDVHQEALSRLFHDIATIYGYPPLPNVRHISMQDYGPSRFAVLCALRPPNLKSLEISTHKERSADKQAAHYSSLPQFLPFIQVWFPSLSSFRFFDENASTEVCQALERMIWPEGSSSSIKEFALHGLARDQGLFRTISWLPDLEKFEVDEGLYDTSFYTDDEVAKRATIGNHNFLYSTNLLGFGTFSNLTMLSLSSTTSFCSALLWTIEGPVAQLRLHTKLHTAEDLEPLIDTIVRCSKRHNHWSLRSLDLRLGANEDDDDSLSDFHWSVLYGLSNLYLHRFRFSAEGWLPSFSLSDNNVLTLTRRWFKLQHLDMRIHYFSGEDTIETTESIFDDILVQCPSLEHMQISNERYNERVS